jgi:hypothetical protein
MVLDSEAITLARRIAASDAKTEAILKLAQSIASNAEKSATWISARRARRV